MRIAFLCSEYPPHRGGGIGTFTRALGRELVKAGVGVEVVGIYDQARDTVEDDQGVRVWRLAGAQVPYTRFVRNGWKMTRKLLELQRQSGLDIVEGQENAFAALGRVDGVKRVIRMNGGHHFFAVTLGRKPAAWRGWQERRSFRQADALCAVSRYVARTTRELLGLPDVEIEILPNPVDTEMFSPRGDESEEDGLIVFAGTVCRKKGVESLVRAMPIVLRHVPAAHLVIAGRDQVEEDVGSLQAHLIGLMEPGIRKRVEFLGPVNHDDLPNLYARAQVCVFPSFMEAQGIVFVEAMAMAKALVAPDIPPVREMIEGGEQALLCDPRQPESIAAQLVQCLTDRELRERMGKNGRERAESRYSTRVLLQRNLDFYRRVLGGQ